ncbi:hypothetical protein EU545_04130 [Candidatus Thorarchaeota archaeon]|nr:MAG: hypothetical protein EU545_04130 [Candidatus Thorarchaeota archaeon]
MSKLAGVVCSSGALGSHLAIVTREFEIPALMATTLETDENLDKRLVTIRPDNDGGGILLLNE